MSLTLTLGLLYWNVMKQLSRSTRSNLNLLWPTGGELDETKCEEDDEEASDCPRDSGCFIPNDCADTSREDADVHWRPCSRNWAMRICDYSQIQIITHYVWLWICRNRSVVYCVKISADFCIYTWHTHFFFCWSLYININLLCIYIYIPTFLNVQ